MKTKKNPKGFYAALGISVAMVGSACYFAYEQGEKLTKQIISDKESMHEAAVDRKVTDVPKIPITTAATQIPIYQTTVTSTLPIYIPPEHALETNPPKTTETSVTASTEGATRLDFPKAPLDDMEKILNPFSKGELVKNETTGSWQTHNGTDIYAEIGSQVYAVSAGEVKSVENDPIWGVTVVIDHHNGFVSRYCNLEKDLSVQKGDNLVSGDIIGKVGNTADIESSMDSHLHIEILKNGTYLDPLFCIYPNMEQD